MGYLLLKAALSGLLIAIISEIARRSAGLAALVASLPLVSILGMIWLWRDTGDIDRVAHHSAATFWYVLPSMPMFLLLPWLWRSGIGFWSGLVIGCAVSFALYLGMIWLAGRIGLRL